MNLSLLLSLITHLGQIGTDLKDFETAAKDLFAGNLTRAEIEKLVEDLLGLVTGGLVPLPNGTVAADVVAFVEGTETLVDDLIGVVGDVKAQGVIAIPADLKKLLGDLQALILNNLIKDFGGASKEQALEILAGIEKGL